MLHSLRHDGLPTNVQKTKSSVGPGNRIVGSANQPDEWFAIVITSDATTAVRHEVLVYKTCSNEKVTGSPPSSGGRRWMNKAAGNCCTAFCRTLLPRAMQASNFFPLPCTLLSIEHAANMFPNAVFELGKRPKPRLQVSLTSSHGLYQYSSSSNRRRLARSGIMFPILEGDEREGRSGDGCCRADMKGIVASVPGHQ